MIDNQKTVKYFRNIIPENKKIKTNTKFFYIHLFAAQVQKFNMFTCHIFSIQLFVTISSHMLLHISNFTLNLCYSANIHAKIAVKFFNAEPHSTLDEIHMIAFLWQCLHFSSLYIIITASPLFHKTSIANNIIVYLLY